MEGALFEAGSKPGIQKHLNLSQLPAMRIPRLWTALHDALVYCKTRGSSNKVDEDGKVETCSALVYSEVDVKK